MPKALVRHQWHAIERLAGVLLCARYLSGSAVAQIVFDAVDGQSARAC